MPSYRSCIYISRRIPQFHSLTTKTMTYPHAGCSTSWTVYSSGARLSWKAMSYEIVLGMFASISNAFMDSPGWTTLIIGISSLECSSALSLLCCTASSCSRCSSSSMISNHSLSPASETTALKMTRPITTCFMLECRTIACTMGSYLSSASAYSQSLPEPPRSAFTAYCYHALLIRPGSWRKF